MDIAKDCQCVTHDGPCWLHSDGIFRSLNISLLEKGSIDGFVVTELQRLREKIWHMEHAGIEEIPPHLTRPDLDERERAAYAKLGMVPIGAQIIHKNREGI